MSYTYEQIFTLVGRDDRTAILTFYPESDAAKEYGESVSVVFIYTQKEREELIQRIDNNSGGSVTGKIKAKGLSLELSKEQKEKILAEGIDSAEILSIFPSPWPHENVFESTTKRTVRKVEIPLKAEDNGGDYDWIYGFAKKRLSIGTGLAPNDMNLYYAAKLYYEPDKITDEDKANMYNGEALKPEIEFQLLQMKSVRKKISEDELKRASELIAERKMRRWETLKQHLNDAGINPTKLYEKNPDLLAELNYRVLHYKDRHLNVVGKVPIYLDLEGFLHIYLRHVEEFQVSEHFVAKDNFQWEEDNVFFVMGQVIQAADKEIQAFWVSSPGKRFNKYGDQSYYFEGDYYTFHVEGNGRVSTFYKNKKNIVQSEKPNS